MKVFNIIFCIIFIFFAALQYNDPDPYIWIPVYLYTAAICALAANKKYYPLACIAGVILYASYAVYKFFEKDGVLDWIQRYNAENIAGSMKAETPWIEDSREFFGLLILIAVLLINYFYARKRSSKTTG